VALSVNARRDTAGNSHSTKNQISAMQAKLIVVRGKATRSVVDLKLPAVIGRHKDADLTIEHPTISRRHCELFEKDGALVVRDFGSLNGTLVDDERVKIELIKPGGVLTVGPLSFRAEYELAGDLPELGSNPLDSGTLEFTPVAEQGAGASAASAISQPADNEDSVEADHVPGFGLAEEDGTAGAALGPVDMKDEPDEDLGFELASELDDSGTAAADLTELPEVEQMGVPEETDESTGTLDDPLEPIEAEDFELELDDLDLDSPMDDSPPPPTAADLAESAGDAESTETNDETRPIDWSSEDDPLPPSTGPSADQNKLRDNGGVDEEFELSDVDFHLESTGDLLDDDFAGNDRPDGAANDEPGAVELIVKKKSPLRAAKETVTIVSEAPIEAVASEPVGKQPKRKRSWWPFGRKKKPPADVRDGSEIETQSDAAATAEADQDDTSLEATASPDTHPTVENAMNCSPELPDESTEHAALQDVTDGPSSTETADDQSDELELAFDEPEEDALQAAASVEDDAADSVMNLFSEEEPAIAAPDTSEEVEASADVTPPVEEADGDENSNDPNADEDDLDDNVAAFLAAAEADDAQLARKPASTAHKGRPAKDEAELDDFLKDLGLS